MSPPMLDDRIVWTIPSDIQFPYFIWQQICQNNKLLKFIYILIFNKILPEPRIPIFGSIRIFNWINYHRTCSNLLE